MTRTSDQDTNIEQHIQLSAHAQTQHRHVFSPHLHLQTASEERTACETRVDMHVHAHVHVLTATADVYVVVNTCLMLSWRGCDMSPSIGVAANRSTTAHTYIRHAAPTCTCASQHMYSPCTADTSSNTCSLLTSSVVLGAQHTNSTPHHTTPNSMSRGHSCHAGRAPACRCALDQKHRCHARSTSQHVSHPSRRISHSNSATAARGARSASVDVCVFIVSSAACPCHAGAASLPFLVTFVLAVLCVHAYVDVLRVLEV